MNIKPTKELEGLASIINKGCSGRLCIILLARRCPCGKPDCKGLVFEAATSLEKDFVPPTAEQFGTTFAALTTPAGDKPAGNQSQAFAG